MRSSCTQQYSSLDQYLAENIEAKGLVLLSRKRFSCDQKETSAFSKRADCPHTLYFEAFKSQPIILEKEENISIHPIFLAKAFLHKDIYNIAKELSSAIFRQEDLNQRNALFHTGITDRNRLLDKLPPVKIDLIERMTKWIFERRHCPWLISSEYLQQVEKYTGSEISDIDRAFLTFENISDFRHYGLPASELVQDHAFQKWLKNEQDRPRQGVYHPPDTIHIEESPQHVYFQRIFENYYCEDTFKKIIALMDEECLFYYTTAGLVRALTLAAVPDCKDFFSGAFQFSNDRRQTIERYLSRGEGPIKAAEVLFRKCRFDFEYKTFNDIDTDFCPIKFLDITRVIAKFMENDKEDNHNKFLRWETIEEIKTYLNGKYKGMRYNPKTSFELYLENGEISTPSTIDILNNQSQNSEINNCGESMEMEIDGPLLSAPVSTSNLGLGTSDNVILPVVNLDNVVVVQYIDTIPITQQLNTLVGSTAPQTPQINYRFDDQHNLILTDFGVTMEAKVWKGVIDLKEKKTYKRVISRKEVRGKKLFDKIFTPEEKALQHSTRFGMTKYPENKVNAILATLSILEEMDRRPEDFQGLMNCESPTVYELTQEENIWLNTKVFVELGSRRRNPKPKKNPGKKRGTSKGEKRDHDHNPDSEVSR